MKTPKAQAAIFSSFFFNLFILPSLSHAFILETRMGIQSFKRLELAGSIGPESIAFDFTGGGPYTGVSDGRVLKWQGSDQGGWVEFAIPSHHRQNEECNGSNDPSKESTCGRPLGLQFSKPTGDLYIADAYFGLLVVGCGGGPATQLATDADGEPFRFTNGLDIDQETGIVYFTDSSTVFQRRNYIWAIASRDNTGRLMKYDPKNKQVTVLLRGIFFPNGVALSKDNTFLLITETTKCRVLRFWLKGPRAGTQEVFAQLAWFPDNIKINSKGEFWVAFNNGNERLRNILNDIRRNAFLTSIWKFDTLDCIIAARISQEGEILEVLMNQNERISSSCSEIEERNGILWMGSIDMPYIGIYNSSL